MRRIHLIDFGVWSQRNAGMLCTQDDCVDVLQRLQLAQRSAQTRQMCPALHENTLGLRQPVARVSKRLHYLMGADQVPRPWQPRLHPTQYSLFKRTAQLETSISNLNADITGTSRRVLRRARAHNSRGRAVDRVCGARLLVFFSTSDERMTVCSTSSIGFRSGVLGWSLQLLRHPGV